MSELFGAEALECLREHLANCVRLAASRVSDGAVQPQSGDFRSADNAAASPNPVQQHVDAIVDDLTAGRVSGGQRATLGRALQDAAIGSIGRKHE